MIYFSFFHIILVKGLILFFRGNKQKLLMFFDICSFFIIYDITVNLLLEIFLLDQNSLKIR